MEKRRGPGPPVMTKSLFPKAAQFQVEFESMPPPAGLPLPYSRKLLPGVGEEQRSVSGSKSESGSESKVGATENGKRKTTLNRIVATPIKLGQQGFTIQEEAGDDLGSRIDSDPDVDPDPEMNEPRRSPTRQWRQLLSS